MPSPFPGLDPFIEGQRWPSFHTMLIAEFVRRLGRTLRPKYVCVVEERVYFERFDDPADFRRPDLQLALDPQRRRRVTARTAVAVAEPEIRETPATVEETERLIHVLTLPGKELVAVLEVLSPSNKRRGSEGRAQYLQTRASVMATNAHLVEVDLLRGGAPLPARPPLGPGQGGVLVSPGDERPQVLVYACPLRMPLPTVSIPLCGDEPPATLDLQAAYAEVYEDLAFEDSLDRTIPLDPPLSPEDAAWVAERLAAPV